MKRVKRELSQLWKCKNQQDEMDEFRKDVYRKIKELATGLNNLRESVQLIEKDKKNHGKQLAIE